MQLNHTFTYRTARLVNKVVDLLGKRVDIALDKRTIRAPNTLVSRRCRSKQALSIRLIQNDEISNDLIDKLFTGIRFNPNGKGCWVRGDDSTVYTTISIDGKAVRANRLAYKLFNGSYPLQLACHSCDTPACINPEHLLDRSNKWNFEDAKSKGLLGKAFLGWNDPMPEQGIDYYKNEDSSFIERI